jgi:phosphoribosylanthranilate isomerase
MTLVKICGITNAADAHCACEAGADLLGFVFYPKSRRSVTREQVREISQELRRSYKEKHPTTVGVFVNEELETVAQAMHTCGLDFAQLHGSEPPELVKALRDRGIRVFKALRIGSAADLAPMTQYDCSAFLLDAYVPGQPGGTGHTFDWSLAIRAKRNGRVILAGGLTPDNVAQAVATVLPWAVDVSSGVEKAPGHKDAEKVHRFVSSAKAANGQKMHT